MSRYDDEVEEDQELEPYELTYVGESKKRGYASKDGKAVAVFSNADTYEGDYKAHKRNGKGTYRWAGKHSGAMFTGEYVDGKKHGTGTMVYPDGSKYVGQWASDKRHGHGVYTYVNGDKYCGAWENGERSGQGTYVYVSSQTQLTGTWEKGKCSDGKWSYYDSSMTQRHAPFEAVIKSSRVAKYAQPEEPKPKAILVEKE